MLTDLAAAKLCQAVYAGNSSIWDKWIEAGGITVGIKQDAVCTIVVFRGSANGEDWLRDLDEFPEEHPILGHVHSGFLEGMDAFYAVLRPFLHGNVYLTGHSLGAAHACILAGLMRDYPLLQRVILFGCPRPGFAHLKRLVTAVCGSIASYRNRSDPVPEVPYLLGLYKHVVEPTQLMSPTDPFNPALEHSIDLYVQALQRG